MDACRSRGAKSEILCITSILNRLDAIIKHRLFGKSCQRLPVRGRKRCRLHGGLSPGAPRSTRNGNYANGEWTAEALEERRWVRELVRAFGNMETTS